MPRKTASKAEFVRGLPATMSAKDVVEKAKEAGHKLTTAYVYVIRSQARTGKKKGRGGRRAHHGGGAGHAGHAGRPAAKGAETRLLSAAEELGLTRSIAVLQHEKDRVVRLLR